MTNKSPAPIDSAKVEDTGEAVADEREAFRSWFRTSGFWNNAITEKAWIAACKWQREELAPTVTMQGGNEALPTNKALERLWEDHAGHPADFGASVLEKWGGWPAGALGYGAPRLPNTMPSTQAVEDTGEQEELHNEIGAALQIALTSGAEQPDWYDAREIDRLADAVITVLPTSSVATPMGSVPVATVLNGAVHWNNETALPHGTLIYAAPASPAPICATCNDHGMIGGPSFYAPDEGGEPCPDCYAAPTTGSEPWQVGDDTSSVQISRDGSTHKWGCKCDGCAPSAGSALIPEPLVFDDWFRDVYMVDKLPRDEAMERRAAVAGWIAAHEYWAAPASPAASALTFFEVGTTERGSALNTAIVKACQSGFTRGSFQWCSVFADALVALLAASMGGEPK